MVKIVKTSLHTGRPRPWAYEIPATFTDDAGRDHNVVLVFKDGKPRQSEIDEMMAFWKGKIEAHVEEPPDEMISKEEVEALLRSKGYLEEGEKLEDLGAAEVIRG